MEHGTKLEQQLLQKQILVEVKLFLIVHSNSSTLKQGSNLFQIQGNVPNKIFGTLSFVPLLFLCHKVKAISSKKCPIDDLLEQAAKAGMEMEHFVPVILEQQRETKGTFSWATLLILNTKPL